jgi:23S rRNA pseudouridine2605 synthase
MTFKDKSRRPGPKTSDRGGKPFTRKPSAESDKPARKPARVEATIAADETKPERISKLLARAGVASRRDVERMIMEGRVTLNGKVLDTPVVNATLSDTIEVDGAAIRGIERTRLWLYHKPAGLVTTNSDPEGRPTVFDNLPDELPRVMSIGRLDINTEGLLLLTNDGGLARVLELPTTGWLRRYRVRAHGEIDQAALDKLKDGIAVDGVLYGSIDATLDRTQGHNAWITMGLREGKNREIKNVLGALGLEVNRLIRISYGPFQLGDLPEGKVIEVRGRMLRDQLGPRLIEDAKANFDAPIYSAGPVGDEDDDAPAKAPAKAERSKWAKPEDRREQALGRLDTKRDGDRDGRKGSFGGKRDDRGADDRRGGYGDSADKPKRRTPGSTRTANVWMAPGARPVSEKKAAEAEAAEKRAARARPDGGADKRYGRTKDGKPTKSLNRFDPDRKGGKPEYGRPDPGPRVQVSRTRDEEGEWIRAEQPARRKDDEGFGGRRSFGDRPERGDRGDRPARGGDRPRGERAFGDRPRDDRPRDDRPREDRPRGDRPFGDKPRGPRSEGRPGGDRPFGDKPRGPRSADSRPTGDRAFGDKPRGAKPFGGKPGGKPGGAKSFSGKPGGGRPGGGKPSGGRGPAKGKR